MGTNITLTHLEQSELSRLEAIIEKGQKTFVEVGSALIEIRDSGLYKQYGTFEKYCKERWGYARATAYRLIDSAKVKENLSPIGDKALPTNESQTRPLTHLPPKQQREVWKEAVETAPEGKVTAKHVGKVAKEVIRPKRYPKLPPPSNGMQFARMAIMDLEKITDDDLERHQAFASVKKWIEEHERTTLVDKPMPERQTRPLTRLEPEQQREASKKALETVPEGNMTGKHVQEIVNEIAGIEEERRPRERDSETFFKLKYWWEKAGRSDREKFLAWVKDGIRMGREQSKVQLRGESTPAFEPEQEETDKYWPADNGGCDYSCEEQIRVNQTPDCVHRDKCESLRECEEINKYEQEGKIVKQAHLRKRFEKFWQAYPKKENREEAEKVWMDGNGSSYKMWVILAALKKAQSSEDWMKNIPDPTAFLISDFVNDWFLGQGNKTGLLVPEGRQIETSG